MSRCRLWKDEDNWLSHWNISTMWALHYLCIPYLCIFMYHKSIHLNSWVIMWICTFILVVHTIFMYHKFNHEWMFIHFLNIQSPDILVWKPLHQAGGPMAVAQAFEIGNVSAMMSNSQRAPPAVFGAINDPRLGMDGNGKHGDSGHDLFLFYHVYLHYWVSLVGFSHDLRTQWVNLTYFHLAESVPSRCFFFWPDRRKCL